MSRLVYLMEDIMPTAHHHPNLSHPHDSLAAHTARPLSLSQSAVPSPFIRSQAITVHFPVLLQFCLPGNSFSFNIVFPLWIGVKEKETKILA